VFHPSQLENPNPRVGTVFRGRSSGPKSKLEGGLVRGGRSRVAEDILAVMGIPLPYTDDGGNLILEFTIGAPNVRGAAQVFSLDLAFGTYTLQ